ncbi:MAG: hypothetical protein CMO60_08275 [Verrucomicrobiales bacterium]|nr:hypothetical protein [Verrucomicrobiales bacterium]
MFGMLAGVFVIEAGEGIERGALVFAFLRAIFKLSEFTATSQYKFTTARENNENNDETTGWPVCPHSAGPQAPPWW